MLVSVSTLPTCHVSCHGGAGGDAGSLKGIPIFYVRLDPGQEWLANIQLIQPLQWLSMQLTKVCVCACACVCICVCESIKAATLPLRSQHCSYVTLRTAKFAALFLYWASYSLPEMLSTLLSETLVTLLVTLLVPFVRAVQGRGGSVSSGGCVGCHGVECNRCAGQGAQKDLTLLQVKG